MKRKTHKERVELCQERHGSKYDYHESNFTNVKEKTNVICPIHGAFTTTFDEHYTKGRGCPFCGRVKNTSMFIEKAQAIHNGKYDYSLVDYKSSHDKVKIICNEHGLFEQTPNAHLNGQGCPLCHSLSKMEEQVALALEKQGLQYQRQKKFNWMGKFLSLDFFISKLNLAIECQGKQHFGCGGWSKRFDFASQRERDERKKALCEENGVTIFYLIPKNFSSQCKCEHYFTDVGELLEEIKYLLLRQENN